MSQTSVLSLFSCKNIKILKIMNLYVCKCIKISGSLHSFFSRIILIFILLSDAAAFLIKVQESLFNYFLFTSAKV